MWPLSEESTSSNASLGDADPFGRSSYFGNVNRDNNDNPERDSGVARSPYFGNGSELNTPTGPSHHFPFVTTTTPLNMFGNINLDNSGAFNPATPPNFGNMNMMTPPPVPSIPVPSTPPQGFVNIYRDQPNISNHVPISTQLNAGNENMMNPPPPPGPSNVFPISTPPNYENMMNPPPPPGPSNLFPISTPPNYANMNMMNPPPPPGHPFPIATPPNYENMNNIIMNTGNPFPGPANFYPEATPPQRNVMTNKNTTSKTTFTSNTSGSSSRDNRRLPVGNHLWDNSALFRTPVSVANPRTPRSGTGSSGSFNTSTTRSTPSSRSCLIEPLDRSTIVALVEGRGLARGEIGIACMNMNTPTLVVCQFNDTQSYTRVVSKINVFRPYEILMSATSCDGNNPSQLYQQLMKEISDVKIIPIQRRIFNEAKGLQKIQSLVAEHYSPVIHTLTNKYYCLAATHALLKYIELMQSVIFAPRTLRIDVQGSDQTCMIDHVTAQHLELLQNNQMAASPHSLLGIVNSCKTPNGARLLRMSILQPSCDVKLINSRLDSVEELMKDRERLFGLQDILGRLPIDIEHVIAFLVQIPNNDLGRITEQRLNHVIALKHVLELVPSLITLLENSEDDYFQSVKRDLVMPQYEAMLQNIKRIIHDEAQFQKGSMNMKRQRCFAVKADINPILDIARKAYCELISDINNYILELSRQEGISFRLGTNNQRGFFVQFFLPNQAAEPPTLPPQFLQVKKRGNLVTFTTESLIGMDHRSQEILKEIENLSGIVISELIATIRIDIGILYKVSEAIGNLDLIYSLANYSLTTPRCVRPMFSRDTTSIRMGRHPILDSISADPSVPNNTFLSECTNFMLITGPNMSGKTTYIKHVALLQVLAQLGCYVPADAATFRIADNIMSRIGTGDNIEENSSSFALEMTEMTYILQNASDRSLIIIDELGRATSVEEGGAMSWAIAEKLLTSKKAFVLFATHHMLLTKLESLYMNVLNFKMDTEEWMGENADQQGVGTGTPPSKLQYTHVLKRGITDVEYYGLKLAMNTCYPPHIIANAIKLSKSIMSERGIEQNSNQYDKRNRDRSLYLMGMHLMLAANSINVEDDEEINTDDVRHYLESLQQECRTYLGYRDMAAAVDLGSLRGAATTATSTPANQNDATTTTNTSSNKSQQNQPEPSNNGEGDSNGNSNNE